MASKGTVDYEIIEAAEKIAKRISNHNCDKTETETLLLKVKILRILRETIMM